MEIWKVRNFREPSEDLLYVCIDINYTNTGCQEAHDKNSKPYRSICLGRKALKIVKTDPSQCCLGVLTNCTTFEQLTGIESSQATYNPIVSPPLKVRKAEVLSIGNAEDDLAFKKKVF